MKSIHQRDVTKLTAAQMNAELSTLERLFNDRGEHGGSPGEWIIERMSELETEQKRRTKQKQKPTKRAKHMIAKKTRLTTLQLARLQTVAVRADGPWRAWMTDDGKRGHVAHDDGGELEHYGLAITGWGAVTQPQPIAELIATAVNALPHLVDEVLYLRRLVKELVDPQEHPARKGAA